MIHGFFLLLFRDLIRTIERASIDQGRSPSTILLEEWGTSGRVRPTMGHLLQILVQLQLFRAADYVAVDILRGPLPQRPLHGPAAIIDTRIPDEVLQREVESIMDKMHYPNTESVNVNPTEIYHPNLNYQNNMNMNQRERQLPGQENTITQSNNNTNPNDQQLNQVMENFARMSTSTNNDTATTSGNTHVQQTQMAPTPSTSKVLNVDGNGIPNTSNSVSNKTQDTNVSLESTSSQSTSESTTESTTESVTMSSTSPFSATIPNNRASTQNSTVINENGSNSRHTESTALSVHSEYTNSFIPESVRNRNSSQSNNTTQTGINSESSYSLEPSAFPAAIGENGIHSCGEILTTTSDTNSNSCVGVPLLVINWENSQSAEPNGSNSNSNSQI